MFSGLPRHQRDERRRLLLWKTMANGIILIEGPGPHGG